MTWKWWTWKENNNKDNDKKDNEDNNKDKDNEDNDNEDNDNKDKDNKETTTKKRQRQRRQRHASYPCLPCLGIISLLLSHSLETVPCAFKLFFVTDYLKGFFSWEQPFIYTRPNTQWHISLYYQVLNHSLLSFSSKCPVYGNNNNNIERAN